MRVSLIGGGSDYPEIFNEVGGFSLGFAINWNVFVTVNALHSSSDENFRIGYRKTESVQHKFEIEHPTVRVLLEELDWDLPISINTYADVPARSGLGGSSAFIAALIKALYAFKSKDIGLQELVNLTIKVERGLACESGGYQDQYMTAFGSFRSYNFSSKNVEVSNELVTKKTLQIIGDALFLTPINVLRTADHAKDTLDLVKSKSNARAATLKSADLARGFARFLMAEQDEEAIVQSMGDVLKDSHKLKSEFTAIPREATDLISELESIGAIGSKLCGAGGGGFIASIVPEINREEFLKHSQRFGSASPGISPHGTQIAEFGWK
jgi:D-glycero-alpha-D-manno-heptose-7-phosphate kinase